MNTMSVLLNIIIPKVRKSKIKYIPLIYKFIVCDWKTQINLSIDFFFTFFYSFLLIFVHNQFQKMYFTNVCNICITFSFLFWAKCMHCLIILGETKNIRNFLRGPSKLSVGACGTRSVKTRDTISGSWLWVGRNRLCIHWLWQRSVGSVSVLLVVANYLLEYYHAQQTFY